MEMLDARSALEAKHLAEAQIAKAAVCPPWRHAVFGLIMAGFVGSPALDFAGRTAITVVMLCLIPVIVQSDRKRTGMFINGYRRGRTRIVIFPLLAIEISLYAVSVWRGLDSNDHVTPLVLGVVGGIVGVFGSMLWQRVFVRELGA